MTTPVSLEQAREAAKARLCIMLGIYAGKQARTPRANDPFMLIGRETLTWLDMLLLTGAEHPEQYCRREEPLSAPPAPAPAPAHPSTSPYTKSDAIFESVSVAPYTGFTAPSHHAPNITSGGGGDFAGAGATGTWEAASSPVSSPAVDSSSTSDAGSSTSSDSGSSSSGSSDT